MAGVDRARGPHGYAFESTPWRVTNPVPLVEMGRFSHEALAFDPQTGSVYLTEDNSTSSGPAGPRRRGSSGFFRFVPTAPLGGLGSLEHGGRLFMLQARNPLTGAIVGDLRDPPCMSYYDVEWIQIDNPDAAPVAGVSGAYLESISKGDRNSNASNGAGGTRSRSALFLWTRRVVQPGPTSGASTGRRARSGPYDPAEGPLFNLFVSQGALAPAAYGADNPDNVSVSPFWRNHPV